MKVAGFHHVTAIAADIHANLEFYGGLLGLRLVWQWSEWSARATAAAWPGASAPTRWSSTTRLRPTPVLDRNMFKSVYFRGPGGVLLEVATDQPGFVFEPLDQLGESLVLIGDLEHCRAELERRFPLVPNPRASRQAAERTSA